MRIAERKTARYRFGRRRTLRRRAAVSFGKVRIAWDPASGSEMARKTEGRNAPRRRRGRRGNNGPEGPACELVEKITCIALLHDARG